MIAINFSINMFKEIFIIRDKLNLSLPRGMFKRNRFRQNKKRI